MGQMCSETCYSDENQAINKWRPSLCKIGLNDHDIMKFRDVFISLSYSHKKDEPTVAIDDFLKSIDTNSNKLLLKFLFMFNTSKAYIGTFDNFVEFCFALWNIGTIADISLGKYAFLLYRSEKESVLDPDSLMQLMKDAVSDEKEVSLIKRKTWPEGGITEPQFSEYVKSNPKMLQVVKETQSKIHSKIFDESMWRRFIIQRIAIGEQKLFSLFVQQSPHLKWKQYCESISIKEKERITTCGESEDVCSVPIQRPIERVATDTQGSSILQSTPVKYISKSGEPVSMSHTCVSPLREVEVDIEEEGVYYGRGRVQDSPQSRKNENKSRERKAVPSESSAKPKTRSPPSALSLKERRQKTTDKLRAAADLAAAQKREQEAAAAEAELREAARALAAEKAAREEARIAVGAVVPQVPPTLSRRASVSCSLGAMTSDPAPSRRRSCSSVRLEKDMRSCRAHSEGPEGRDVSPGDVPGTGKTARSLGARRRSRRRTSQGQSRSPTREELDAMNRDKEEDQSSGGLKSCAGRLSSPVSITLLSTPYPPPKLHLSPVSVAVPMTPCSSSSSSPALISPLSRSADLVTRTAVSVSIVSPSHLREDTSPVGIVPAHDEVTVTVPSPLTGLSRCEEIDTSDSQKDKQGKPLTSFAAEKGREDSCFQVRDSISGWRRDFPGEEVKGREPNVLEQGGLDDFESLEKEAGRLEEESVVGTSVLEQRLSSLQTVRLLWSGGDVGGTLVALTRLCEDSAFFKTRLERGPGNMVTVVHCLERIDLRGSCITLDVCVDLLPVLYTLLQDPSVIKQEAHVIVVLRALSMLCTSFGTLIRDTTNISPCRGQVDLQREQRREKCQRCSEVMHDINTNILAQLSVMYESSCVLGVVLGVVKDQLKDICLLSTRVQSPHAS